MPVSYTHLQSVVMEEIIVAIVIGLLIGLEFLSLKKAEGTVLMKFGKILTICIFVVAFLLGCLLYTSRCV